jgi:hypothetical protein
MTLLLTPGFKKISIILLLTLPVVVNAQTKEILPPVIPWSGKSQELIAKNDNAWITIAEKSGFTKTPDYAETMLWFSKACEATPLMRMVTIGKSANNRDINAIIVSADATFDKASLIASQKPFLLIQAGIHAGEIDGKDAGMMLLRDIAFGKKKNLLQGVNLMFIPILNVDGHERSSAYNRVNQRGPDNMGWRTNARNLNLNRDYAKLDTEEISAVVNVMNDYNPALYLDLHVTDGADYQYDITYGFSQGYSPAISQWLTKSLMPLVDQHLKNNGHIPGPLMFAANDIDFTQGNIEFPYQPRFSNMYGDARHLPSILVENHSLKPYKQRVLGTYIFLEGVINALNKDGAALKTAIDRDLQSRNGNVILSWKRTEKIDSMTLLGIQSEKRKSTLTNNDYVVWLGKPVTQKIAFIKNDQPDAIVSRPKAYWIPATYQNVIERLRKHGVKMESVTTEKQLDVKMYRIMDHKFSTEPFEGHFSVTGNPVAEKRKEKFYPGAVRIDTNQPLGDLVMLLLEPQSGDSFFQWGFFLEIFNRTEYIEGYAMEPLAHNMLANEKLRAEFEKKKQTDPDFATNPQAIYEWFYTKSPYVDERWLLYPVGIEE